MPVPYASTVIRLGPHSVAHPAGRSGHRCRLSGPCYRVRVALAECCAASGTDALAAPLARATWQCGPGFRELTERKELLALELASPALAAEASATLRFRGRPCPALIRGQSQLHGDIDEDASRTSNALG